MDAFIGVDLGTTSIKGLMYDAVGQCRAQTNKKCFLRQTAAGAATEDPVEILNSTKKVLQKLLQKADELHLKPISLSFSSANQSLLALNDQFQPLTALLTWADTPTSSSYGCFTSRFASSELISTYWDTVASNVTVRQNLLVAPGTLTAL